MYCIQCGFKNVQEAKYCNSCGARIPDRLEQSKSESPDFSRKAESQSNSLAQESSLASLADLPIKLSSLVRAREIEARQLGQLKQATNKRNWGITGIVWSAFVFFAQIMAIFEGRPNWIPIGIFTVIHIGVLYVSFRALKKSKVILSALKETAAKEGNYHCCKCGALKKQYFWFHYTLCVLLFPWGLLSLNFKLKKCRNCGRSYFFTTETYEQLNEMMTSVEEKSLAVETVMLAFGMDKRTFLNPARIRVLQPIMALNRELTRCGHPDIELRAKVIQTEWNEFPLTELNPTALKLLLESNIKQKKVAVEQRQTPETRHDAETTLRTEANATVSADVLLKTKMPIDQAETLFFEGKAAFLRSDWEKARSVLERAVMLAPGSSASQYLYGASLAQLGLLAQAIEPLTRSVELNPNVADAQNTLGMVLGKLERYDEGERHLARAAFLGHPQAKETLANTGLGFCPKCGILLSSPRTPCSVCEASKNR